MTEHDDLLGAALRGLRVPEHRPGFWDSSELGRTPRKSHRPRRLAALAAVAAAVVSFAGLAVNHRAAPTEEVAAGAGGATQMLTGVRESTFDTGNGRTQASREDFAIAVDGSTRSVQDDGSSSRVYDASTRREVVASMEGSGRGLGWFIHTNMEPPPSSTLLGALTVAAAGGAPQGTPETFLTRPARTYERNGDIRVYGGIRQPVDRERATVDDETGFVLAYDAWSGGALVAHSKVVSLEAHQTIKRVLFRQDPPPGSTIVQDFDESFIEVKGLSGLRAVVGYGIDAPAEIAGQHLTSVTARRGMPGSQSPTATGLDRDRVHLVYSNGWVSTAVTIRRSPESPNASLDPVTRMQQGDRVSLPTEKGDAWFSDGPTPHTWIAVDGAFVMDVTGALGPDASANILNVVTPRR